MSNIQKQDPRTFTLAAGLYEVEKEVERLTHMAQTMRGELMKNLKEQGVRRVDLDTGDCYIRVLTTKLVIKNEGKALKWALENPEARMNLSRGAALKVAKSGTEKFFSTEPSEQLRILRRGQKDAINTGVDTGDVD